MKITVFSDIHLEFLKCFNHITSRIGHHKGKIDIAILAGDIGHYNMDIYSKFLETVKNIFKHVIVIPGNHEYLCNQGAHSHDMIDKKLKYICNQADCIFLNKETVTISNIKFIGCTLWSDLINCCPRKNVFINHHEWLVHELAKKEESVVITHHCPSFRLMDKKYQLYKHSDYFYSNLDYLIRPPIKLWVCGHSHVGINTTINKVPVIMNPIGYFKENSRWNDNLIINI